MLFFIYILILFSYCSINSPAFADDIIPVAQKQTTLKVNSINFDNSDSIIFLGTSGGDNSSEIKITKQALTNPDRIFFDIENAVITFPNSTYEIKNSRLKQVRIAQNSIEPNIVRIVIWNSPNYDASHIKILKINNNIVIKLSNEIPIQQYLTQTYKETKESAIEYYEKAVAIQEEAEVKPQESDEIFNKVQQAFKEDNQELVRPNIEQRQARLKSRFFLENAEARNGNLLIGGIGVVNVEKPFVLTEPNRVVFDLPNTIVLQELRDKEFKLSETATVKIGQFEPSKARIVIKTDKPETYRPIYSTNLQTLLIAKSALITGVNLSKTTSELAYFKEENVNSTTDVINIIFSNPIIYSIKREDTKLYLYIYNLTNFNADSFNATSNKNKAGFEAKQIGTNAFRFTFPIKATTLADCYETLNASQLRFVFTTPKTIPTATEPQITPVTPTIPSEKKQTPVRKPETKPQPTKKENPFSALMEKQPEKKVEPKKPSKSEETKISKIKKKMIIIDPGHGGNDTGALRGSTLEKDLTLKIALKVRDCLREKGLKNIILTRYTDKTLSLDDRVQIANKKDADIFVSIHINASVKSEINGIETHYYTDNGYNVAKIIHKELMNNVDAMDRGLFKSKFYVINHTEAPAVLLELGFISNEQERSSLNSSKRQMDSAQAIADGIVNYLVEYRRK